jgi:hypothetical protein
MMTLVRMEGRISHNQESCRTLIRVLTTLMEKQIFTVKVLEVQHLTTMMVAMAHRENH